MPAASHNWPALTTPAVGSRHSTPVEIEIGDRSLSAASAYASNSASRSTIRRADFGPRAVALARWPFFRETSTPERCFPSRDRWPLQPRRQLDRRCSPAALHIRQVWRGASLCARRVGQVARLSSRSPEWFQLMCFGSGYRQRPTRPPTQHRRHVPPSGHQETSWVQPKCRAGMWRGVPRLPDGANQS